MRIGRAHGNPGNGNFSFIETDSDIFSGITGTLMDGSVIKQLSAVLTVSIFMRVGIQAAKPIGDFGIHTQGMGQIDIPKITGSQLPDQNYW